ncbi:hypothetical protein BFP70_17325 [Thioclava sp. SK-1]|nr:hypothetical protein BFP70_17325 [Thioclava sp. SK-1]
MTPSPAFYSDQVSLEAYLLAFFYIFAVVGIVLAIVAIICIDAGLVRRKHMLTTIVQKITGCFVGGIAFMIIGYGIWNWQYYEAFGVERPLMAAIQDWWIMGGVFESASHRIDPAAVPHTDLFQVFAIFFFLFGSIGAVLVHGAGLERIKSSATYITSIAMGGVAIPIMAYLTYGSLSPLTNNGLHDFVGAYSLYLIVGTWSPILAWRLGKRRDGVVAPGNPALLSVGAMLLIVAIPMFVIGCGFMVPGQGYFGPTMTETGLGLIFENIFMALTGGGIVGAIFAHRTGKLGYILLGPIVGYISCSALFDIATPIEALAISTLGPVLLVAGEKLLIAIGIDEPKVTPLTLLPAAYSGIAAGVIGAGTPQGGYFGFTEGPYLFQGAQISISMQLLGIVVVVGITAVIALVTTFVTERTTGLRVSEEAEWEGMDRTEWKPMPEDPEQLGVQIAK